MINYIRISSKDQIQERLAALGNRLNAFWNFDQHELIVEFKPHVDKATRSQQNLYWQWMGEMASYFTEVVAKPGIAYDKEDFHDLMRHKFLGSEDKVVGQTTIKHQLRSTSTGKISKEEMSEYMSKIEAWATDKGLLLTIPHANEYMKYKEASQ